jgi:hypothetical protein
MIIIQDTREKIPWNLTGYEECKGQEVETVYAGDYVLKSDPFLITIDRKRSVTEIAGNLGRYVERFERELERMQRYQHRFIVCEFPYDELLKYPKGVKIPRHLKRRIRISGKFLAKQVTRLAEEYDVQFIFCNGVQEAQEKAIWLFKTILEYNEKQ